jgi:D-tyrosyl-tRNA(Tyr) deacylase
MRAVLQRVSRAAVRVQGQTIGQIERGLLVLLGVACGDTVDDARWLAEKIVSLRVFNDDAGKMNLDLQEVQGSLLVVSQFTLLGDCRKGRRPSFVAAAPPETAIPLYEAFIQGARALGIPVQTGRFGAMMEVELVNDGPVTLILERSAESEPAS